MLVSALRSISAVALLAVGACATTSAPPTNPASPASPNGPAHGATHDHAHHAGMPHRFERADEWAKQFDDPSRDAWQRPDEVLAALELTPALTVADVGAGTGYFAVRLARAVTAGQVIATDIEPDMVRYLGERATREGLANLRAVLAGADAPNLPPASVDRILVVDVWHHLGDRARYAAGLAAALRPGGKIAVVDFTADATRGPPAKHRLSPDAIVGDLRAAGLDAQLSPIRLPEQYIVIAARR